MKLNSIKYRLLLIILVCVLGMLLLMISQFHSTQRLIELNQQRLQLLQLNNELLQMRRHEKDFLLRFDMRYAEQLNERAASLAAQLAALSEQINTLTLPAQQVQGMLDALFAYQRRFDKLVELQSRIGFDEQQGEQGRFRQAIHALETRLSDQAQWQILLLQMRRSEKDFMLRKRMEYAQRQQAVYEQLEYAISQSAARDALVPLLQRYQQGFLQLVESNRQIGLNHELGLKGQFRAQAHLLEQRLTRLELALQPILAEQQREVERNGMLIMSMTLFALLLLLIQSFVTFQRAFSAFIQFFYRCKREYQRLDERKLGFAEFRSLAAVANEMVESRLEMERELKETKQELARLREQQHVSAH
ncbi:hypothetical protein [Bowmanella denitrificans]|uniref:hypothetical protein n=1 Tax=Bowmanella denitrificans TaxID=366582 RepID=UPI000C9AECEE|nr:hypothetical protein [Bowmanella denitrificans]